MKKIFLSLTCLVALVTVVFAQLPGEYVLGPADVLKIQAWDEKNADLLYVNPIPPGLTTALGDPHIIDVSMDGRIYLPLIGVRTVTGMTIKELEAILRFGLSKLVKNPNVAVFVVKPKPVGVSIFGEVKKPGLVEVPDGDPATRRIMTYLQLTGGLTSYGDLSNINIIRFNKKGERRTINVNLMKIAEEMDLNQNIILEHGDTVIVGSAMNNVFVLGEVSSPGPRTYIFGASVSDYILAAGGFNDRASRDSVKIIRGDITNPVIKDIRLGKLFSEGKRDDVTVMKGDVIFVEGSWLMTWTDALSILRMVRDTIAYPRDIRDAYIDLSGEKRPVYYPTQE